MHQRSREKFARLIKAECATADGARRSLHYSNVDGTFTPYRIHKYSGFAGKEAERINFKALSEYYGKQYTATGKRRERAT